MVVALPTEKKVSFYSSPNLKSWTHLTDFGPAGSTSGLWECPDVFPLPIEGESNAEKWVLLVNVNPGGPAGGSGCQYFVGNFDGQQFVMDSASPSASPSPSASETPQPKKEGVAGEVLADFEGDNWGDWKATGSAFGSGPSHPAPDVTGYAGHGIADSFGKGDSDTGELTSPEFIIGANYITFLIGGGSHPGDLGINLIIDGDVVRSATGNNRPQLEPQQWDVREYFGKTAKIQIFDHYTKDDWGHILVDQIALTDEALKGASPEPSKTDSAQPPSAATGKGTEESSQGWADYGCDFYAGTTWSNIPASDGRCIMLGWMSNWDYAGDLPTSPWRGAMTIPRVLTLRRTPDGLRLIQKPVVELQKLSQGLPLKFSGGSFSEAASWLAAQKNLPLLLDVQMTFTDVSDKPPFTVEFHTGPKEQTSVACDPRAGRISVDRTQSGQTAFHKGFARRPEAPIRLSDGTCTLRMLLDTSSLEVFAQDGETVLTDLIFPGASPRTLGLTTRQEAGPRVNNITIQPLKSIW
jgi:sucrose-6-phosphate hydrolase SacC (GH32 family)